MQVCVNTSGFSLTWPISRSKIGHRRVGETVKDTGWGKLGFSYAENRSASYNQRLLIAQLSQEGRRSESTSSRIAQPHNASFGRERLFVQAGLED